MESLEQQEKINDYRNALDALLELNSDKYRKAINDLRHDLYELECEADRV